MSAKNVKSTTTKNKNNRNEHSARKEAEIKTSELIEQISKNLSGGKKPNKILKRIIEKTTRDALDGKLDENINTSDYVNTINSSSVSELLKDFNLFALKQQQNEKLPEERNLNGKNKSVKSPVGSSHDSTVSQNVKSSNNTANDAETDNADDVDEVDDNDDDKDDDDDELGNIFSNEMMEKTMGIVLNSLDQVKKAQPDNVENNITQNGSRVQLNHYTHKTAAEFEPLTQLASSNFIGGLSEVAKLVASQIPNASKSSAKSAKKRRKKQRGISTQKNNNNNNNNNNTCNEKKSDIVNKQDNTDDINSKKVVSTVKSKKTEKTETAKEKLQQKRQAMAQNRGNKRIVKSQNDTKTAMDLSDKNLATLAKTFAHLSGPELERALCYIAKTRGDEGAAIIRQYLEKQ